MDKADKDFGLVSSVFAGIGGRARDFLGRAKLLLYNRLAHAVSLHRILESYPGELFDLLGLEDPSERSLYRTLEQVGRAYPVLLERYQDVLLAHGLVDREQLLDFSSTYFEGEKASLAAHGYSRDHRPDRRQITFGISTGINDVPCALTIQRGNTQDKKHLNLLLSIAGRVLEKGSLLIFDAGANSKANKKRIRRLEFHYLTLKPKKLKSYRKHVRSFPWQGARRFTLNEREYLCVKKQEGEEHLYIFFSPQLFQDQLRKKEQKFMRRKEAGNKLVKLAWRHRAVEKYPSDKGWIELYPQLQAALAEIENPYANGIEGFFILESSVDAEPEKILALYKERDRAEKFIRSLKEGVELRPIRHWSKWAVIGSIFISFLAAALTNLTVKIRESSPVRNVKLLKKYLMNLTLTVIYPKNAFRLAVVSNVTPPIKAIFGDFIHRYGDKNLDLRW